MRSMDETRCEPSEERSAAAVLVRYLAISISMRSEMPSYCSMRSKILLNSSSSLAVRRLGRKVNMRSIRLEKFCISF